MKKWRVLFWLVAIFVAIDFVSLPAKDSIAIWDFVGLILSALGLIPLYGYSYSLPIGNKPIAIGIFGLNAAKVTTVILYMVFMSVTDFNLLGVVLGLAYISILCIWLYPQFMYAFKSDETWQTGV